jgi:hypothetical protein
MSENAVIAATVNNMRDRMERCRRLARFTTDDKVAATLLAMADEIETDMRRLQSQ